MKAEWATVALGDLIDVLHGYAFPGESFTDVPGEQVLVTPGNFAIGGGFQYGKGKYFVGPVPPNFVLSPGDLVVTMTDLSKQSDTLGYPAFIPEGRGVRFLHNQRVGKIVLKPGVNAELRFLYYVLCSDPYRREVLASATGTGVKHTAPKRICAYRFGLPSRAEQRAISTILGTLDDKIDLNRRMNQILKATAWALFRSWFVSFDPVRSKAEGAEASGVDAQTAAMFPNRFVESELGDIPEGWRTCRLGDRLETRLGGTPSKSIERYWSHGTVPWINSGAVNDFPVIAPSAHITEEALANSATKLLPVRTTVLAITGATLGQVSLLEINACANQSVVGVLPTEDLPGEYVFLWCTSRIDDLLARQTGAAQQHVNKNDVNALPLLVPSAAVIHAFSQRVRPLFDRIRTNCFESRTLAEIRDLLLPKLLSGEISVCDAEAQVSASA